jgi:hypothetical protein
MFCPRCGKQVAREERICSNCGLNLEITNPNIDKAYISNGFEESPHPTDLQLIIQRISTWNFRLIVFSVIALTVLVLSFIAAYKISGSADQIMKIRTTGGQTLNEVYDREMGNIYAGFAMFIRACGIFFSFVLVELGLKNKK